MTVLSGLAVSSNEHCFEVRISYLEVDFHDFCSAVRRIELHTFTRFARPLNVRTALTGTCSPFLTLLFS